MVDVGAIGQPGARTGRGKDAMRIDAPAVAIEVRAADADALAGYDAFCRRGVHGPAQHPLWVRAWVEGTGADALIVAVRRDGETVLKLALEVVGRGPFRIARFPGASHANGNFPACAPGAAPLSPAEGAAIVTALRKARPDIDLVALSRQAPHFEGAGNPLAGLATMRSPNISLAVDLAGGFEAVLSRHSPARKRKKLKYQVNRYRQIGGHRLIEAATPQEVERLIATFFALKGASLRSKGISDSFADEGVRAFFRALFHDALAETDPPFLLRAIEVAGEIVAVTGLSVTRETVVCNFTTYSDADPRSSPGFLIDHANIETACGRGRAIYDFGVGDEPYKRSWCDIETRHFETLMPLGAKGHGLALYERGSAAAIEAIKSNPAVWGLIRRLRARLGGAKPAAE